MEAEVLNGINFIKEIFCNAAAWKSGTGFLVLRSLPDNCLKSLKSYLLCVHISPLLGGFDARFLKLFWLSSCTHFLRPSRVDLTWSTDSKIYTPKFLYFLVFHLKPVIALKSWYWPTFSEKTKILVYRLYQLYILKTNSFFFFGIHMELFLKFY